MRTLFPGHYRPSEQEFAEIWKNCIFAFDTNILFNFYRYTESTREQMFSTINRVRDRIWLPYQVAYEYHKDRLAVIDRLSNPYTSIEHSLTTLERSLKEVLSSNARHPFIDELRSVVQAIDDVASRSRKELSTIREQHPDYFARDEIKERIADLFEGHVGEPYTKEKNEELYLLAEERIQQQIPPGYKDTKKEAPRKYGDIMLWFQLLDFARAKQISVIFVTDDQKEDWWLEKNGRILGPRPELIEEMTRQSNVFFHMYKPDQFLRYAEQNLALTASPKALQEIQEVSREHIVYALAGGIGKLEDMLDISQKTLDSFNDTRRQIVELNERLDFLEAHRASLPQRLQTYDSMREQLQKYNAIQSQMQRYDAIQDQMQRYDAIQDQISQALGLNHPEGDIYGEENNLDEEQDNQ